MVRKFAGFALLAAAIQAQTALAVGLGDINVNSALNQPLGAQISLTGVGDLASDQILVKLASKEDFDRAGVSREYFLSDLQFSVQGSGANTFIRVSTPRPVREPYLDFLVEVKWPSGRLLREYTVLLDIEPFSAEPSVASVAPAPRAVARPRPVVERPAPLPVEVAAGGEGTAQSSASASGDSYAIREGDTLWSIARKVKPSDQVSVKDTVDALYANNKSAFVGGDINRMEVGRVLRVPTGDEILALKQGAVPSASPRDPAAVAAVSSGPAVDARKTAEQAPVEVAEGEKGHLKLAAPETKPGNQSESGGVSATADAALKSELAASKESLDKTLRENTDLKDKVNNLEKQVQDLERLVSLKDERLATLQEKAAGLQPSETGVASAPANVAQTPAKPADTSAEAAVAVPPAEQAPVKPAEASSGAPAEPKTPTSAEPVQATQPPAEAAQTPAAGLAKAPTDTAKPEQVKPSQPPSAGSAADKPEKPHAKAPSAPTDAASDDTLVYAGGGLALLVLLGGLGYRVLQRRREAAENEQFEADESVLADAGLSAKEPSELSSALDELDLSPQPQSDVVETQVVEAVAAEEVPATAPGIKPETTDPLSEADIYIAYGRHDQAAGLLRSAIEQEPERADLRIKLLEVYADAKNAVAFAEARDGLKLLGDSAANARAEQLAKQLPLAAVGIGVGVAAAQASEALAAQDEDFMEVAAPEVAAVEEGFDLEKELASLDLTGADIGGNDFELDLSSLEADAGLQLGSDERVLEESAGLDIDSALAELEHGGATELDLDAELSSLELGEAAGDGLAPLDTGLDLSAEFEGLQSVADEGVLPAEELTLDLDHLDLGGVTEPAAVAIDAEEEALSLEDFGLELGAEPVEAELHAEPEFSFDAVEALEEAGALDLSERLAVEPEAQALSEPVAALPVTEDHAEAIAESSVAEISLEDELAAIDADMGMASSPALTDADIEGDEVATKLDLARAYADMGDAEGAREILNEVLQEGNDLQRQDAEALLAQLA